MRATLLVIHRWLGLTVGIVFGVASITGAVLVFETEIDVRLNAGRFRTTPGLITGETLDLALAGLAEAGELRRVRWPTPREPVFEVERITQDGPRIVWLDPGTGSETRPTRGRSRIVPGIRRLHANLFAGIIGHWVMTVACALALLGLITGVFLWWPGAARLLRGFAIRVRRGFYILNYDLHQTLGIVTLPLVLVLTLTGVLIPMYGVTESVVRFATRTPEGPRDWPPVTSSPPGEDVITWRASELLAVATRSAGGGAQPDAIVFPASPDGVIEVRLRTRPPGQAGGDVTVLLDRYRGTVLQVRDPRTLDPALRIALIDMFNWHIGAFGGSVIRGLWFVGCLAGGIMLPTGILVWWLKRQRKLRAAEARSERLRV